MGVHVLECPNPPVLQFVSFFVMICFAARPNLCMSGCALIFIENTRGCQLSQREEREEFSSVGMGKMLNYD